MAGFYLQPLNPKEVTVISRLMLLLVCFWCSTPVFSQEGTPEDKLQLQALLETVRNAVNARDVNILNECFSEHFSATKIDQKIVTTRKELEDYYREVFTGEKAIVKSLVIAPEADALTRIHDGTFGTVYGRNIEKYELTNGKKFTIHSRWTSAVPILRYAPPRSATVGFSPFDPVIQPQPGGEDELRESVESRYPRQSHYSGLGSETISGPGIDTDARIQKFSELLSFNVQWVTLHGKSQERRKAFHRIRGQIHVSARGYPVLPGVGEGECFQGRVRRNRIRSYHVHGFRIADFPAHVSHSGLEEQGESEIPERGG
jgi:hypothetical protein